MLAAKAAVRPERKGACMRTGEAVPTRPRRRGPPYFALPAILAARVERLLRFPVLGPRRGGGGLGVAAVDAAVETHRRPRHPDPARAALVVLALLSTPGLFAAAAWGIGAGSVLLAASITRALGRRWLSGAGTPLWIDRHARLEGRLATALELERRGGARAPFFPLLVDDNARRLAAWRPERLVPEGMPSGAFAGALAAVGAFLLALLIAPWLQP